MLTSIIAVVFTFGLVIFLHELGHFLVCKYVGIRVDEFSFGFGKELYGFTRGVTRYSVRLIPLGGYVKPAGEDLDEEDAAGGKEGSAAEQKPRELAPDMYFAKPWYTRLAVVFAGPVMNYLLAFVLFSGVIIAMGEPVPSRETVIGEVNAGFPAEAAGLKSGDRVVKVAGQAVDSWDAMAAEIHARAGKQLVLVYSREGKETSLKITPRLHNAGGKSWGVIGISPSVAYKPVPLLKGLGMGLHQCWYWTAFTVKTLASNIQKREKPDLAGPIGIVNIVSKAAHSGFADFLFLIGLISVAVGFFNLLPIPLLDGGHAVLFIFEGVSRRKLTPEVMKYVNLAGVTVLAAILVFATYSDIMRIKSNRDAKKAAAAAAAPEK